MNRDELTPTAPPEEPLPDEPHTGLMGRFRNYFLTGLIVAGPLAITLYLTWWFVNWVDSIVRPFVPTAYRPETYLPFGLPGSGLIVAVVALTLLGFLAANLIGRTLVDLGERLLGRMPVVRAIYRGAWRRARSRRDPPARSPGCCARWPHVRRHPPFRAGRGCRRASPRVRRDSQAHRPSRAWFPEDPQ
jgi:hypothetical protein